MSQAYALLEKWVRAVREVTDFTPEIGIVLGSGLGDFARLVDRKAEVSYDSLPGFPVSTVAGHAGKLIFGYVRSVPVVVMQGRVHYYEGYSTAEIAGFLGCPDATVRSRLSRARKQLQAMLGGADE